MKNLLFFFVMILTPVFSFAAAPVPEKPVPEIGCWFWNDEAFYEPGEPGHRAREKFLDTIAEYQAFDTLVVSPRSRTDLDDPALHEAVKDAVITAREKFGIKTLLDADIRMARHSYVDAHPDKCQEKLLFAKSESTGETEVRLSFSAGQLTDHYTGGQGPYTVLKNRLVRSWTFLENESGEIVPGSIKDVTAQTEWTSSDLENADALYTFSETEKTEKRIFAAASAFTYHYPDLFSKEMIDFETNLVRSYADTPLFGTCKDEWGFPPCPEPDRTITEYWFSDTMASAYFRETGRDLVDDLFLTRFPQTGRTEDRFGAVDAYNRLCRERNVEIETAFVRAAKESFGPEAFASVHPTWYPYPGCREFRKNGLDWWQVPRSVAQTDESAPYYCRTSLSKKTNSVWINMFYASEPNDYAAEHWSDLLAGGRVDLHPIWPCGADELSKPCVERLTRILDAGNAEARRKIRNVDLISNAPLWSPAAVIFGDFAVMNFARSEWDRVSAAIRICDTLSQRGYPADLLPVSETACMKLDEHGFLQYGCQSYKTVILAGETHSDAADFLRLRQILEGSSTSVKTISLVEPDEKYDELGNAAADELESAGIPSVTPWTRQKSWGAGIVRPARAGIARYVDNTYIWVHAEENAEGDRFVLDREKNPVSGSNEICAVARGFLALRFDEKGSLIALAAGNLESFSGCGVELTPEIIRKKYTSPETPYPPNIALIKDQNGVFQPAGDSVPERTEIRD